MERGSPKAFQTMSSSGRRTEAGSNSWILDDHLWQHDSFTIDLMSAPETWV